MMSDEEYVDRLVAEKTRGVVRRMVPEAEFVRLRNALWSLLSSMAIAHRADQTEIYVVPPLAVTEAIEALKEAE